MRLFKSLTLFLLLTFNYAFAQSTGKTHSDKNNWITMIEGNMPLVISVPHGGSILLDEIPLRSCKDAVTVTDSRTIELAMEIQKAFIKKYNMSPYIVICNLSRKNVDQNRPIEIGTCGVKEMEKPWNDFHNYIDTALNLAVKSFGNSIYIDLHGHGHPNQRLELGYLLSKTEIVNLKNSDHQTLSKKSSLTNLLNQNSSVDIEELLIGNNSFGTLIENNGFSAVPSKQDEYPKDDEKYFNGGYNTLYYNSSKYPNVFGFQIESNYKGVRDREGRPLFANAFADAIIEFIKKNTTIALK